MQTPPRETEQPEAPARDRTALVRRLSWSIHDAATPMFPRSVVAVTLPESNYTDDDLSELVQMAEVVDEWHLKNIRPPHFDGRTNYIHVEKLPDATPDRRWRARRHTWESGGVYASTAAGLRAAWLEKRWR